MKCHVKLIKCLCGASFNLFKHYKCLRCQSPAQAGSTYEGQGMSPETLAKVREVFKNETV